MWLLMTAAVSSPSADPALPIDRAIARAAFRGERVLSIARIAFCVATTTRALSFTGNPDNPSGELHALVSVPGMAVAIGFSCYMLARGWRRDQDAWLLTASTVIDALVCFVTLVPNSLWPGSAYGGILRVPDTAAILIVTAVSGLRLSPRAAAWATALNGASLAVLIAIDVTRSRIVYPGDAGQLSLFIIYLGGAAALALIVAIRTRHLVAAGAAQAVQAEQAGHRLHMLLQDHHDVRTALASATLNADLAMAALDAGRAGTGDFALRDHLTQVREDLRHVGHVVSVLKEEARAELRFHRTQVAVDAISVLRTLLPSVQRQFPRVRLTVDQGTPDAYVTTGDGARTLERVFLNLIVNACEGNGTEGAQHVAVQIETSERPGWLRLTVQDDGPGFPLAALSECGERAFSTKSAGSGIGLLLTANLLRANGSDLVCANRLAGGARASFELPHADAASVVSARRMA